MFIWLSLRRESPLTPITTPRHYLCDSSAVYRMFTPPLDGKSPLDGRVYLRAGGRHPSKVYVLRCVADVVLPLRPFRRYRCRKICDSGEKVMRPKALQSAATPDAFGVRIVEEGE